jgi:hypothetical protein
MEADMRFVTAIVGTIFFTQCASAAPAVHFMGVETQATTVAFVCDGSRWTRKTFDDLADQLEATVEAMTPEQQFAVIFFADDKTFGVEDGRALQANAENKRKLHDWLRNVRLENNPTPIVGLTRAFEVKPEAVFFVSSGEFRDYDNIADHVAKLNGDRKTHLHTIPYFESEKQDTSRAFVRFMKKLAEDNAGTSKVVYADELKRTKGI